jgi:hypothetical protein
MTPPPPPPQEEEEAWARASGWRRTTMFACTASSVASVVAPVTMAARCSAGVGINGLLALY